MFSDAGFAQEVAALLVALTAVAYLFGRLTGWPKFRRSTPSTPVQVGRRLSRGLTRARRGR